MNRRLYSVDFEYLDGGTWYVSRDRRCYASSPESAIRRWRWGGYGNLRNAVATELAS